MNISGIYQARISEKRFKKKWKQGSLWRVALCAECLPQASPMFWTNLMWKLLMKIDLFWTRNSHFFFCQRFPRPSKRYKACSDFFLSHARLTCSVVNALTMARCRYQLFASCERSTPTAEPSKISFSSPFDKYAENEIWNSFPRFKFRFLFYVDESVDESVFEALPFLMKMGYEKQTNKKRLAANRLAAFYNCVKDRLSLSYWPSYSRIHLKWCAANCPLVMFCIT